jgi:hypothetical protein
MPDTTPSLSKNAASEERLEERPVIDVVRLAHGYGYAVVLRCTMDSSVAIGAGETIEEAKRRAGLFAERLGNAVRALNGAAGG